MKECGRVYNLNGWSEKYLGVERGEWGEREIGRERARDREREERDREREKERIKNQLAD